MEVWRYGGMEVWKSEEIQGQILSLKNLGIYVLNTSLSNFFQSLEALPVLDFSHFACSLNNYFTNSL